MRLQQGAVLATVALLLSAAVASAQSLGEAAAREKERRKGLPSSGKSFTDDDLGRTGGVVNNPGGENEATTEGEKKAAPEDQAAGPKEKTEDEVRAEAEKNWKQQMDVATKMVAEYQALLNETQLGLNDTSGGVYTARRANAQRQLEEIQQKLNEVQQKVGTLEQEGRRQGFGR